MLENTKKNLTDKRDSFKYYFSSGLSFNDVLRDPYLLKDVKDGEELEKLVNDPIYDPLPEGVAPPKE